MFIIFIIEHKKEKGLKELEFYEYLIIETILV